MPTTLDDQIDRMLASARREQLRVEEIEALADRAIERGLFIRSMEVFERISETRQPLRPDLSILGLEPDWDARARHDLGYCRQVLAQKLALAAACTNALVCEVWLDEVSPSR